MHDKTVLITGSTGGIGLQTARQLAAMGAQVILVGRNPSRAEAATRQLREVTGNSRVHALTGDVSRQADLRDLAATVTERFDRLDVLVNNAGVNHRRRESTADGVETDFATNVLAPFTLSRLLLPSLAAADDARIINLTGGIPSGPIDPRNLQAERKFVGWTFSQYNHSKLAVMAMSLELSRRLTERGITVNVGYPGHAYTPGNRAMSAAAFPWLYRPLAPVLRIFGPVFMGHNAIVRASRSSVELASSTELGGVTGIYLDRNCRRRPWPPAALEPKNQAAVWQLCERLCAADER